MIFIVFLSCMKIEFFSDSFKFGQRNSYDDCNRIRFAQARYSKRLKRDVSFVLHLHYQADVAVNPSKKNMLKGSSRMGSISFLFPLQENDRGNEDRSPIRTTTLPPTSMDSIDINTIVARYVEHMFS